MVRAWELAHPSMAVRYLREPVAGASRAHNRGLAVAEGEWVVRTDDDVVVDPQWFAAVAEAATSAPGRVRDWVDLAGGGRHGGAGVVGAVRRLRARVRSAPGGYGCASAVGSVVPVHDAAVGQWCEHRVRHRAVAGPWGVRRALGPGTRARGGEDLLAVFDVLAGGGGVVYEPSALVWHWNRRDYASLRTADAGLRGGARGVLHRGRGAAPGLALGLTRHAAFGVRHVVGRSSPKNPAKRADYPRELERRELLGMVAGPAAYLRGRGWSAVRRGSAAQQSPEVRDEARDGNGVVPILLYHSVADRPSEFIAPYTVSPATLPPPSRRGRRRRRHHAHRVRAAGRAWLRHPARAAGARHVRRRLPRHADQRRARPRRARHVGHDVRDDRRGRLGQPGRGPDADLAADRRARGAWVTRSARTARHTRSSTRSPSARCGARSPVAAPGCRRHRPADREFRLPSRVL